MTDIKEWLKKCEGYRSHPYKDSENKLTIGWGRNIEQNGITLDEAELLFENDLRRAKQDLAVFSWYVDQPEEVKNALINMSFNMGITKLLGFKKMIQYLTMKDYTNAAREALQSKWASQVGQRAKDVALMISLGK